MADSREISWKINAYSRETMPLDRLLKYLDALSIMLGEAPHLHLIRIESASTVPVFKVDEEAAERVRQRATLVRTGTAPLRAMREYRRINRMLREDEGSATLLEGSAEIVPFPGKSAAPEGISGINQPGNLDGELQKVGGRNEWSPVQLQLRDESILSGCYARRYLAKELGHHLFEPVRLYGRGRWNRSPDGEWTLDRFYVDSFDRLDDKPLPSVVEALRATHVRMPDDPVAKLETIRHGPNENQ